MLSSSGGTAEDGEERHRENLRIGVRRASGSIVSRNSYSSGGGGGGDDSIIGASLLPFLGNDVSGAGDDPYQGETEPEGTMRPPSFLLDGGTFTDSGTGTDSGTSAPSGGRERILLRGPPKSGKTSLAMDLAYAKAAAHSNCCGGLPCGCVACIVYRPKMGGDGAIPKGVGNNDENDADQFPLFCRPLPGGVDRGNCGSLEASLPHANANANPDSNPDSNTDYNTNTNAAATTTKPWDPNLLKRIRICRVASLRQLWWELLVLAGKPRHEQPSRAIVVEDLDQFLALERGVDAGHASNYNRSNYNAFGGGYHRSYHGLVSTLQKTMALATDTALAIEHGQKHGIALLVTLGTELQNQTSGASASTASDVLLSTSCLDTLVTLRRKGDLNNHAVGAFWRNPSRIPNRGSGESLEDVVWRKSNHNSNNSDENHEERVLVHEVWQAEIRERERHCPEHSAKNGGAILVDYAIVESIPVVEGYRHGDTDDWENCVELRWKHGKRAGES
mmetsp:Transcript_20867/g.57970  ORF Transcript_20867/g.57970 Transcript_20867/m.57970 type:complete len:504 (+) Transcript_20867:314-1825(+)